MSDAETASQDVASLSRIPAELVDELRALLAAIPDAEISRLAASVLGKGGFRPNTKPALLRATIASYLVAGRILAPALRIALSRHCLQLSMARMFTQGTLKSNLADLAAACGAKRLLLAFWLDDRDDVRRLAFDGIQRFFGESPENIPAADEASARLRESLGPLLSCIGASAGAAQSDSSAADVLKAEIAELKNSNRRLRDFEDRYNRAAEREKALDADAKKLRDQLFESRREAKASADRVTALEAEVRRLREDDERRVAAAVDSATATAFAGFLARHSALVSELEGQGTPASVPRSGDALLDRARAALDNQAREDATSGTFSAFRSRLREVEDMLARTDAALADAVRPLPSLRDSAAELRAEARRLRERLGSSDISAVVGFCEKALISAASKADAASLSALSETVDRLESLGALESGPLENIRSLLRKSQDVLHATTAPVPRGGVEPKDSPGDPSWVFRSSLRGEVTAMLLVDGHNMLFALQSRYFGDADGKRRPDSVARAKLVDDFVRLVGGHPTVRVWIVFDGPESSDTAACENVRVSYSGGTGEHRADRMLVENARFFGHAGAENILLATNDNGLAGDARKAGAKILSPGALIPLL